MGESDRRDDDDVGSVESDIVHAEFDWSTTPPSTAVIETVAAATDREPTAIGPLFESVDPDALDAFVDPSNASTNDANRLTSFEFAGKHVTVRASGHVAVQPID